jgi:hypothetical protein
MLASSDSSSASAQPAAATAFADLAECDEARLLWLLLHARNCDKQDCGVAACKAAKDVLLHLRSCSSVVTRKQHRVLTEANGAVKGAHSMLLSPR